MLNIVPMQVVYLVLLFLIAYSYVIYPIISFMVSRFRKIKTLSYHYPEITIVIAAYNEIEYIAQKIENTLALDYPPELLKVLVVTDGSTDGTEQMIFSDQRIQSMHLAERKGKAAALNRAFSQIKKGVVICTDANTMLNKIAIKELVKHFQDPGIGAVAGEKRLEDNSKGAVAENYYWKYESQLRQWDSLIYAVPGAAGELFAIQRDCFTPISEDTVCDDLLITMQVLEQGKRVIYEPLAYGVEKASVDIAGEWKRKCRIAAGNMQFMLRFNMIRFMLQYPLAAFQLFSRKIVRWLIVPYCILALFIVGIILWIAEPTGILLGLVYVQTIFFTWALLGLLLLKHRRLPSTVFFAFYFMMANSAMIVGGLRYLKGDSFVLWEKVRR